MCLRCLVTKTPLALTSVNTFLFLLILQFLVTLYLQSPPKQKNPSAFFKIKACFKVKAVFRFVISLIFIKSDFRVQLVLSPVNSSINKYIYVFWRVEGFRQTASQSQESLAVFQSTLFVEHIFTWQSDTQCA